MMAFGERIPVKTRREVERMREAARHVAEVLLELREEVRPGITTGELDRIAEKAIAARGVALEVWPPVFEYTSVSSTSTLTSRPEASTWSRPPNPMS